MAVPAKMSRLRLVVYNVAFVVTSIRASVFVIEFAMNAFFWDEDYKNRFKTYRELVYAKTTIEFNQEKKLENPIEHKDPVLFFSYKPNETVTVNDTFHGYEFTMNVGDDGLRRRLIETEGPTAIFIGDSVTFGWGVEDDQTYPHYFASLAGERFNVVNAAVAGYGPVEYYLQAKKMILEHDPQTIFINYYFGNDFNDFRNSWYPEKQSDGLPTRVVRTNWNFDEFGRLNTVPAFRYPVLRNLRIWRVIFDTKLYVPLEERVAPALIAKMANQLNHLVNSNPDIDFVVSITPRNRGGFGDLMETDHVSLDSKSLFLAGVQPAENLRVLDLFPSLFFKKGTETLNVDNAHFSPHGNLYVAARLLEFLDLSYDASRLADVYKGLPEAKACPTC